MFFSSIFCRGHAVLKKNVSRGYDTWGHSNLRTVLKFLEDICVFPPSPGYNVIYIILLLVMRE